jgi:glutamate synthase domain-containing protein 3
MDNRLIFDLEQVSVRDLNAYLHGELKPATSACVRVINPYGQHNIAVGVDAPARIDVHGHVGYFLGGMNKNARITVHGNAGRSLAENIMSGTVHVNGDASESVGASGHGGMVVVDGNASSRCGISLKGADIVVGGNVGHMSAFMAQSGRIVICGDAGPGLGDSLYEAVIYVGGSIQGLGADAREEEMTDGDAEAVVSLLSLAGMPGDASGFRRVASARTLYHWNSEVHQSY